MAGTGVGSLLFPRRRAELHVAETGTHTLGQMGADIAAGDAAGRAEIESRSAPRSAIRLTKNVVWDHAGVEGKHFVAVKKDLLVSVGRGPSRSAATRATSPPP
jgi:hypothetical protein